jgi:hypothetical protein
VATAKGGYYLKDGTRVPSVTTVLGRFKDAGPLLHWSWKLGLEGKDYRKVRDDAANAGTLAHEAAEAWAKGQVYEFDLATDVGQRASTAFGAFLEWTRQTKFTVERTEQPLVSEKYGFGGTFDLTIVNGKRAMSDYKTSGGVYVEYLAQIAAYGLLFEENHPEEPLDGGYHLLRFDKVWGDLHTHWWPELDAGRRFFLALLAAYKETAELKQRAS